MVLNIFKSERIHRAKGLPKNLLARFRLPFAAALGSTLTVYPPDSRRPFFERSTKFPKLRGRVD